MSAASATTAEVGSERGLSELVPHLVCPLCRGYFIDATAIVECLHTFCRSCILRHLRSTRRCPEAGCDVLVQRGQSASAASLRPDTILQSIVYKTVPGLHRDEMRRRQLFYADKPDAAADLPAGTKGLEEDGGAHFYDANDTIDLRIQYASQRPEDVVPVRYLRCPAGMPLSVLRKLLHTKYQLSENLRMELLHEERRLPGDVKLLDVAYMVNWDREAPLELLFRLHKTRLPVKRSATVLLQESSRPSKVRKMEDTDVSTTIVQAADKGKPSNQVKTKPVKIVTKAVASSIAEKRVGKAGMKRSISNGPSGDGGSTTPPDHDVRKKSGSVGMTSNQKRGSESANGAWSMRDGCKKAIGSPTVTLERIDKKRKTQAIDTTRKDTSKDTVPKSKLSNVSKTALPISEQKQKHYVKPQPGPVNSIQLGSSMPMLSIDKMSSSGKVDGRPGPVVDIPPKHTGNKVKSSTNKSIQLVDHQKNHPTVGANCGVMDQEDKTKVKQTNAASHDSNANRLKNTEKAHRQRDLEKKTSKHQSSGTKGQPAKATDPATPIHKQQTYQKKTKDADVFQTSFQKLSTKDDKCLGTTFKSATIPVNRPSSAKIPTMPLQSVKAKQNQGKSPKTTSHGTNTFLSSSPQITKSQTSSSSSPVHNTFKPAATSLYSRHGESPTSKDEPSGKCSPSLQKTNGAPDVQRPSSKTIFLFSGSKKPQNSNRIMSIVESLTQKNLLSSLAKQGNVETSTNQPAKQSNAANGSPGSNSPATSKASSVKMPPTQCLNGSGAPTAPFKSPPAVSKSPPAASSKSPPAASKSPPAVSKSLPAASKTPPVSTNGIFVAPSPVPVRSVAATPGRSVSSPLHIETASLGLRFSSAVPPLSGLSRPAPSSLTSSTSSSSRPVFPVLPLPQRPKSQNVRSIPNPSLVRQRSADERARDCGKGSPTAGTTAPTMSPTSIRDIHSLTRQLKEAGTSVTITNNTY